MKLKKLRDELQAAIDQNDMASLKTRLETLENAMNALSQSMYQNAANTQNSANNTGSQSTNDDNVVDADFKEKK